MLDLLRGTRTEKRPSPGAPKGASILVSTTVVLRRIHVPQLPRHREDHPLADIRHPVGAALEVVGDPHEVVGPLQRLTEVAAGPDPDRVTVTVADEGRGIPPADLQRIFERFYRGDRARTHRSAGLGLTIACRIVTGHGGEIHAANNRERGATYWFTLLRGA